MDIHDLGSRRLTWPRLALVVANSGPGSALVRSMHPEHANWWPLNYQIANLQDLAAGGNWQRGGDSRATRPDPAYRPGVAVARQSSADRMHDRLLAQRARLAKGG